MRHWLGMQQSRWYGLVRWPSRSCFVLPGLQGTYKSQDWDTSTAEISGVIRQANKVWDGLLLLPGGVAAAGCGSWAPDGLLSHLTVQGVTGLQVWSTIHGLMHNTRDPMTRQQVEASQSLAVWLRQHFFCCNCRWAASTLAVGAGAAAVLGEGGRGAASVGGEHRQSLAPTDATACTFLQGLLVHRRAELTRASA